MTVKPLNSPTVTQSSTISKTSILLAKKLGPDILGIGLLIILPLIVYWSLWAPNPADRTIFKGDILMQGYPSRYFVHRLFNLGEIPLWNPYQLGGMPLLADVQVAVFYLPNLLLDILYRGQDLPYQSLESLIIFHYILGSVCFYAYLRGLNIGVMAALIGAIAFEFNGFFVGHRGHYNMLGVVVWVPGVLWLLDRSWLSKKLHYSIAWAVLAGFLMSQMIMAGHPQLTFYSALFILAYFFFRWIISWAEWKQWLKLTSAEKIQHVFARTPLTFALAGIISAGISAVALLPTAELLSRSMRNEPTYIFSAAYSLLPRNFINLLVPEFLDWSVTEFRIYAGILTLILALVAWIVPNKRLPEQIFFLIILIGATLVAIGGFTSLQGLLYRYIPGFSSVRVSARAFFFANFALAVMAAYGANTLLKNLRQTEVVRLEKLIRYGRLFLGLAAAVAILFYALLAWNYELPAEAFYTDELFTPASPEDRFEFLTQTTNQYLLFVFFLFAALTLIWLRSKAILQGKWFGIAAIGLMALDVTTFAPYHDTVRVDLDSSRFTIKKFATEFLTEPWQIQDQDHLIKELELRLNPVRVDNRAEVLPDNYSQVLGLPFNSGYNILDLQERFFLYTQWPEIDQSTLWDLSNVGYILTPPENLDPPELNARLILQNSQGILWQRANQPDFAYFATELRPNNDLITTNGILTTFPRAYKTQPSIALADQTVRELFAKDWPQLLEPANYQIGKTGQLSPVNISVLAGGQGSYSAVIVDGITVTPKQRGIVYATIDQYSGKVLDSGGFDTYLMQSESDQLAAMINAVPSGTIIALATYDEGFGSFTDNAQLALKSLGATEVVKDKFGQAYGLIGVKGSTPGSALEKLSEKPVMLDIGLGAASKTSEGTYNSQLLTYRPNQITLLVENNNPGLLVVTEPFYPGWTAFVNGHQTPIVKANGLFRAVVLPATTAGQPHEVTFVFNPLSVRLGSKVTLLTLVLAAGLFIAAVTWQPAPVHR